jgi:hypothetical protein
VAHKKAARASALSQGKMDGEVAWLCYRTVLRTYVQRAIAAKCWVAQVRFGRGMYGREMSELEEDFMTVDILRLEVRDDLVGHYGDMSGPYSTYDYMLRNLEGSGFEAEQGWRTSFAMAWSNCFSRIRKSGCELKAFMCTLTRCSAPNTGSRCSTIQS